MCFRKRFKSLSFCIHIYVLQVMLYFILQTKIITEYLSATTDTAYRLNYKSPPWQYKKKNPCLVKIDTHKFRTLKTLVSEYHTHT